MIVLQDEVREGRMVQSRFRVLLAEKEMREKRSISLKKVADETGISIYTISGFASGTLREIPVEALSKLCRYLDCTIGDLLVNQSRTPSLAGALP